MSGLVGNSRRHVLSCRGSYPFIVLFSICALVLNFVKYKENKRVVSKTQTLSNTSIKSPQIMMIHIMTKIFTPLILYFRGFHFVLF